jgi:hypothetical protein
MSSSSYEIARNDLFNALAGLDESSTEYANAVKALETLNKAEASQIHPETPEETGVKAWFEKHSDALIKVGGTFGSIALIGFVESKFDVIFRSKASKYL